MARQINRCGGLLKPFKVSKMPSPSKEEIESEIFGEILW